MASRGGREVSLGLPSELQCPPGQVVRSPPPPGKREHFFRMSLDGAGESLEHVMGGVQSGGSVSCPVTGGFRVSSDGIATQQRASSPPTPDAQVFALPTQAVFTANSPGTVMLVTVSLSLTLVSPILDRVSSLSGPHGSLWISVFTFITHPNFHHPWSIFLFSA